LSTGHLYARRIAVTSYYLKRTQFLQFSPYARRALLLRTRDVVQSGEDGLNQISSKSCCVCAHRCESLNTTREDLTFSSFQQYKSSSFKTSRHHLICYSTAFQKSPKTPEMSCHLHPDPEPSSIGLMFWDLVASLQQMSRDDMTDCLLERSTESRFCS